MLHRLADLGNSVVIIEHNLDVIRNADWLIDMGPEGGEDGGRVIAEGRPAQVAAVAGSYTGEFLAKYYAEHGLPVEAPAEVEQVPSAVKEEKHTLKAASKKAAKKTASQSATRKKTVDR